jgi:polar amino acid transport system permease protein
MNYDWNFARLTPYAQAFLKGTGTTLELTFLIILVGTVLGVLVGLMMRNLFFRRLFYPPVDVLRAIPPLVLLLFLYYLLTEQIIGTSVSAFWVAVTGLSLNLAAFVADLTRSAIDNVDPDSVAAALALGMSDSHVTRYVVLPHVVREVIPGLTILYVGILKTTSLAAIINVREVVYTAQTVISDISRSLEAWTVVACIYIVLVIPATYGSRIVERWAGRGHSVQQSDL